MKINTIIFDFGGVITDSPLVAFRELEKKHSIQLGTISKVVMTNPDKNSWAQCERGEININQFIKNFEREAYNLGYKIDMKLVLQQLYGPIRPLMVSKIKELSKHYQLVCLTNVLKGMKSITPKLRLEEVDQVLKIFYRVYESFELGMRKPEEKIYKHLLNDLEISPEKCVFLDDLGVNLKTARRIGIHTIKVGDPKTAINELDNILEIE